MTQDVPEIGQRWQFHNKVRGNKYIVEVMSMLPSYPDTDDIEVQIVQVFSTDVPEKNYVGRVFSPTRLRANGTGDNRWSLMSGQENPDPTEEKDLEEEEEEEEEEEGDEW